MIAYSGRRVAAAFLFFCAPFAAHSQTPPPIKPGLWEVRARTEFDGQRNQTLGEKVAELPADQRGWVEQVIQAKGLPTDGVNVSRHCFSSALLATQRWHTAQECTATYGDRSDAQWRWHSTCPRAETDGEAAFQDAEHFAMRTVTTVNAERGGQQVMRRAASYVWLGADCGTTR